ncbi:MAG: hypothetical protein HRT88_00785 [Lentisphaeraceae bacterium]|nr:hypothetical protein [Lentisphaeraceae bacterium]
MNIIKTEIFLEFVCDKKYRTHKAKIIKKLSPENHNKLMDSIELAFDILNDHSDKEKGKRILRINEIKKKISLFD